MNMTTRNYLSSRIQELHNYMRHAKEHAAKLRAELAEMDQRIAEYETTIAALQGDLIADTEQR